ncbi:MAG TPA: hypothetical protein VGZ73_24145 [Bryobacteraceae bacterium]|nr:hypothetical protein [Bryobacteraceae bacterium]
MSILILGGAATFSADPPILPLGVCEVLRELAALEGKNVAVIGRYSFREAGRWIGEQSCTPTVTVPLQLWLVEDSKGGPKPPGNYELDGVALNRKFAELQRRTPLGKFRFGTPDYDRWAVVYGRVEARKGEDTKRAAANLVIRGDGVIIVLTPE